MGGGFLRGLEYPLFAGLGAIVGLFAGVPVFLALGFLFPALWGAWLFAPVAAGAVIGLIFAAVAG